MAIVRHLNKMVVLVWNLFSMAVAGRFNYCCSNSETFDQCQFEQHWPSVQRDQCLNVTWTDDVDAWNTYEFVKSLKIVDHTDITVTTSLGNIFQFGFILPQKWVGFRENIAPQVFTAYTGRHVNGLFMNSQTSSISVVEAVTEPIPVRSADCMNGQKLTCPLSPLFSYLNYRVSGSESNPKCVSEGSYTEERDSFTFDMDECNTLDWSNSTHLNKKVILVPERTGFYFDYVDHPDLPENVECTCSFDVGGEASVALIDNGASSQVLRHYAEGENMTLRVDRVEIEQGKWRITVTGSTKLDHIELQECIVDPKDTTGQLSRRNLPLVFQAKSADGFTAAELQNMDFEIGGSEKDVEFLKQLNFEMDYVDKDVTSGQMVAEHSVSLDGITAGFDTLVFICTYRVCHKNDNKACVVGRQLAAVEGNMPEEALDSDHDDRFRRLEEEQKEMVYLSDSKCLGRQIPDVDTSRPGVVMCPGSTTTAVPGITAPAAEVESHNNVDSAPTRLPKETEDVDSGHLAGLCALVAVAVCCFHL